MNRVVHTITRAYEDFIRIEWEDDQGFFGRVDMNIDYRGDLFIDSENMSKEFVKSVLCKMVDDADFRK